jgi:hypothetical protein
MDRMPAISGKVSSSIRVRFDRGPHMRPEIVACRVLRRHGFDGKTWTATVEHQGREVLVEHTMVRGLWRPRTPRP